jgi:hypothetical protein
MVTGRLVITSAASNDSTAGVSIMRRRRSPSVMIPASRPLRTTHVMPIPLRDIS